jgi:dihydrofolate reductase
MRELVLQMGVSIDGYVATIDGAHDWGYAGEDPETKKWKLDSIRGAGAHLMGRQTYGDMAAVWPESSSDYARAMNEIPKVVFSKTLKRAEWPESHIAAGELADEIARLKAEEGGYLLAHGGAKFARALSRERLVDEYRLVIHPAALGDGLALFKDLPRRLALELIEAHTYSTGAAIHVYRPRDG